MNMMTLSQGQQPVSGGHARGTLEHLLRSGPDRKSPYRPRELSGGSYHHYRALSICRSVDRKSGAALPGFNLPQCF
jgi:hypothetical protein